MKIIIGLLAVSLVIVFSIAIAPTHVIASLLPISSIHVEALLVTLSNLFNGG